MVLFKKINSNKLLSTKKIQFYPLNRCILICCTSMLKFRSYRYWWLCKYFNERYYSGNIQILTRIYIIFFHIGLCEKMASKLKVILKELKLNEMLHLEDLAIKELAQSIVAFKLEKSFSLTFLIVAQQIRLLQFGTFGFNRL